MKFMKLDFPTGKSNSFRTVLSTIIISLFITVGGYAQICNSELGVYRDRDSRSASIGDPTQFQMELTNNSNRSQAYDISIVNAASCESGETGSIGRSTNHTLITSVDGQSMRGNQVIVPARSKGRFQISVAVPAGMRANDWRCLEVKATSSDCPKGTVKVINVYVADPNEN